jgi:tetratricopeptide (TPR) repeat protein
LALGASLLAASCLPGRSVVRVYDGHEVPGRFISAEAYRDFVAGALAEARGDERAAAAAYTRAIEADGESAEAWSGLGRVLCLRAPAAADHAFARAEDLGKGLSTPPLSAAACALARGRPALAAVLAEEAVRRAPHAPESTALLGEALRRSGKAEAAERWTRGLRLLRGHGLRPPLPAPGTAPDTGPGLTEALRRLRADPRDADARIAVLVAADLAADEAAFLAAASPPTSPMDLPSEHAARELERLLGRRLGDAAARAFVEAYGTFAPEAPGSPSEPR